MLVNVVKWYFKYIYTYYDDLKGIIYLRLIKYASFIYGWLYYCIIYISHIKQAIYFVIYYVVRQFAIDVIRWLPLKSNFIPVFNALIKIYQWDVLHEGLLIRHCLQYKRKSFQLFFRIFIKLIIYTCHIIVDRPLFRWA